MGEFVFKLCKRIDIRKSETALTHGTGKTIFVTQAVPAYRRTNGTNGTLCVLNLLEKQTELKLELTESALLPGTRPDCRIQEPGVALSESKGIPPHSGVIVK